MLKKLDGKYIQMFTVLNEDTILPQYPCGGRGEKVSVNLHGVNWAVQKLVDDFETHVGYEQGRKPKCAVCVDKIYLRGGAEGMITAKDFIDAMSVVMKEEIEEFTKAMKLLGESTKLAAGWVADFMSALNKDLADEADPNP